MSDLREIEFHCPHCKARIKGAFQTRVEAGNEPDLAAQLLAGTLSEVICRHCRERTPLEHSLVYIEGDRTGAIWLDPPNDPLRFSVPPVADASCLRRVRDSNALRELATIWRDGLDDRAMLLLKHMLAARMMEETGSAPLLLAYEDRFTEEGEEWLEYVVFTSEDGDPESLRTPFATYRGVEVALEASAVKVEGVFPPFHWTDWDGETAKRLWEAM